MGMVESFIANDIFQKDRKAEQKRLDEEKKIKEAEIEKKREIQRREKRNLLATKLSSLKAAMGAGGLNATSSSSNALMEKMEKDTDEKMKDDDFFADLNLAEAESEYNYRKRKNLLAKRSGYLKLAGDSGSTAAGIISLL